jgi:hypothetical protein
VTIDTKVEEPLRQLLGHAIRGEFDEMIARVDSIGERRFLECLSLCLRISGYIAIDICGYKWPTNADVREIAQLVADVDMDFDLAEADVCAYLSRATLGFEPLIEVFPEKEKAVTVPFLVAATLLVSYRTDGKHWWEYLDVIERALEEAAAVSEAAVPAVLLLSRRTHALKSRATSPDNTGPDKTRPDKTGA